MNEHDAARTVIALVNAYRLDDPTASAMIITSLDFNELALVCAAAVTDLTHIWAYEAERRGLTFDAYVTEVTDALERHAATEQDRR